MSDDIISLLKEVAKIYRRDSLYLVRLNLQNIGRKIKEEARSKDIRKFLRHTGISDKDLDLWAFDEMYNAKKAYELSYRTAETMDDALFGSEEAMLAIEDYDNERGFSFIDTADRIEDVVVVEDYNGKSPKEISDKIFSIDGVYGARAIVDDEKDLSKIKKSIGKQSMRDYFFMSIVMENCIKRLPEKRKEETESEGPNLDTNPSHKFRGDINDWGKVELDLNSKGYEFLNHGEDEEKEDDDDDEEDGDDEEGVK